MSETETHTLADYSGDGPVLHVHFVVSEEDVNTCRIVWDTYGPKTSKVMAKEAARKLWADMLCSRWQRVA